MSKRTEMARRIAAAKEKARLLRIVLDGGGTFSEDVDANGEVEIICKGERTGKRVSLGLANKIRGVEGAEVPRPKIAIQNLHELTPEILERDYPSWFRYVEEMSCCFLIFNDCAPQDVELNVQRVGFDTLKHWYSKRESEEVSMPDVSAVTVEE